MIISIFEYVEHFTLEHPRLVILRGLSGVGKTYLANQLADRYCPDACIFSHHVPDKNKVQTLHCVRHQLAPSQLFRRQLIICDHVNEKNTFGVYISAALTYKYYVDVVYVEDSNRRKNNPIHRGIIRMMPENFEQIPGDDHRRAKALPTLWHVINTVPK